MIASPTVLSDLGILSLKSRFTNQPIFDSLQWYLYTWHTLALLGFFLVVFAAFVCAIVPPAKREFPSDIGSGVGNVFGGAFDIGNLVTEFAQVSGGSFGSGSFFENVVISNPTINKHADGFTFGYLNPANRNVHSASPDTSRGNLELSRFNLHLIGISEVFGKAVWAWKRLPVDHTLTVHGGSDACILPRQYHRQAGNLFPGEPFYLSGLTAIGDQGPLHGFHVFAVNVIRLAHHIPLPLSINRVDDAGRSYGYSQNEHSNFRYGYFLKPSTESGPAGYVMQGCGFLSVLCASGAAFVGFCGINYRDWR